MRLRELIHQLRRAAGKAHLPAGEREHLSGRADFQRAVAEEFEHRDVLDAVERDVLPDFVADDNGVVSAGELRKHRELFAACNTGGWVERRVEHDDARLVRKRCGEGFAL